MSERRLLLCPACGDTVFSSSFGDEMGARLAADYLVRHVEEQHGIDWSDRDLVDSANPPCIHHHCPATRQTAERSS